MEEEAVGVYSLVAEQGDKTGKAIRMVVVPVQLAEGQTLTPDAISVAGQDDRDVKHSARRGAWIAYQELKNRGIVHPNSEIAQSGVTFDFAGDMISTISGPSAGLCFLTKMAQELVEESLHLKGKEVPSWDFAATGILTSLSSEEKVGGVETIEAKVKAALASLGREGVVFYPRANDPLNPALYRQAEQKQITLVAVDTPRQALDLLLEKYGISEEGYDDKIVDPNPGWPKWVLLVCIIIALGWWITSQPYPPGTPPQGSQPPVVQEVPSTTATTVGDQPPHLISVPSLSLEAALFYEEEGGKAMQLPEGKVLTKGDAFRVRLEVDRSCFLYVFEVDSENHVAWLFPPQPYSRPLPRAAYWIPGDDLWIELDEVRGEELILALAAAEPSVWLEDMRESIHRSKDLPASERRGLRNKLVEYLDREQRERGGTLKRLPFPHG